MEPFLDSSTGMYTPEARSPHLASSSPISESQPTGKKLPTKRPSDKPLETEVMLPSKKKKADSNDLDSMDKEIDEAFAGEINQLLVT